MLIQILIDLLLNIKHILRTGIIRMENLMFMSIFIGLIYNVAFLYAMGMIYTIFSFKIEEDNFLKKILVGMFFGLISVVIMVNPIGLFTGAVFDT